MERNRKNKLLIIFALVFSIASLSIGFATFSVSLNVSSSASVSANSDLFSVKFSTSEDDLVVSEIIPSGISNGISATNGIIDNSTQPTVTGLSATFTEPGQFVEYTFYARNVGEYIAYLNSVNYYGEKLCESEDDISSNVQSACDSINLKIIMNDEVYTETTEISGHSLAKNTGEKIIIRIEYDSDGGWADAPFKVTYGNIMLIYSTVDDSNFVPSDSLLNNSLLLDVVKEGAVLDTDVDFSSSAGLDIVNNVAYIRSGTEDSFNPIYYYRGNVTQNNVKFANFCWKIVRTTDTGGIKLVYNGVSASDGSCNNTGESSTIGSSTFNQKMTSPSYVGYMYGDIYTYLSLDMSQQSVAYFYGNDVEWDGEKYSLVQTISSSSWEDDRSSLAKSYHYTCMDSTSVCNEVYYIVYFGNPDSLYAILLKDGNDIEATKKIMFNNDTDSSVKSFVDSWYSTNMTEHTSKIEDTIWCNDRTFSGGALYSKDTDAKAGYSYFGGYNRVIKNKLPIVNCPSGSDSFTVNTANGNGKLLYPVGLLTVDETLLCGGASSYLDIGLESWTMTPTLFSSYHSALFFYGDSTESHYYTSANMQLYVRPAISLRSDVRILEGDGTVSTPYIVE